MKPPAALLRAALKAPRLRVRHCAAARTSLAAALAAELDAATRQRLQAAVAKAAAAERADTAGQARQLLQDAAAVLVKG